MLWSLNSFEFSSLTIEELDSYVYLTWNNFIFNIEVVDLNGFGKFGMEMSESYRLRISKS